MSLMFCVRPRDSPEYVQQLMNNRITAPDKTSDKRLKESAINRQNIQDVVMAEINICLWLMTKY